MPGFVYIAGPYRPTSGTHDWTAYEVIDRNIAHARSVFIHLAEAGVPAFCPHVHSQHFEVIAPHVSTTYWLETDHLILDHAAVILLLDGWRSSEGAQSEYAKAVERGILIYDESQIDDLIAMWPHIQEGRMVQPCRTSAPVPAIASTP